MEKLLVGIYGFILGCTVLDFAAYCSYSPLGVMTLEHFPILISVFCYLAFQIENFAKAIDKIGFILGFIYSVVISIFDTFITALVGCILGFLIFIFSGANVAMGSYLLMVLALLVIIVFLGFVRTYISIIID